MAEEAKVTPEAEVNAPIESVAEIANAPEAVEDTVPAVEHKAPETVPLPVYLELKDDLKSLKKELKELKGSDKTAVQINGIEDLTKKYPDVSEDFIRDMLTSATSNIDNKYKQILEKQETEKKIGEFNKAFDALFEKTLNENPELPKNIDKEVIKELSLTSKYRNVPLAKILTSMYNLSEKGKASSEDEIRTAADKIEDIVSFDKITPEQKKSIMADPKARAKYFSWLDTQLG